MASKFSDEIIAELNANAPLDFDKVSVIAEKHGEKPKALVACATRNGIEYKRKARVSKSGNPVASKADLVAVIASNLSVDVADLDGLDKATKNVLEVIVKATQD